MALNFPDVCKTPAPPAPFIPVPYPDLGMNMQAAPFSPFVQVGFMPATNMGSLKVMTSGDEAGAMGGLITGIIKGPGMTTMGNPIVFVTGLPAESLLNPTSGNNMNAPVGAQIVPSVVNVLYTYKDGPSHDGPSGASGRLDAASLRALADVVRGEGEAAAHARVRGEWISPGVALLRVGLFTGDTDREVFNTLREMGDAIRSVVLDLRGNPGGDGAAALRLACDWLPRGTEVLRERDADGDEETIVARGDQRYPWPLSILIDGGSASAAELLAGALQHHGRATVIGEPSYGKATGQRALCTPDGAMRYTTVAEYLLPNGERIEGRGVTPDVALRID
jgi:carboxyl-terminal processing protease